MKLCKLITTILFLVCFISSCGNSNKELSLQDIPYYPASIPEQSMEGSSPAGMIEGELIQLSTNDPFEAVEKFYMGELEKYSPEILSHTSELGRQTAITIKQKNGMVTVSIQEHNAEKRIVITHMAVGS